MNEQTPSPRRRRKRTPKPVVYSVPEPTTPSVDTYRLRLAVNRGKRMDESLDRQGGYHG